MNNHLDIPLVPELSTYKDANELAKHLCVKGGHGYINSANWSELFPNKPNAKFDIAHTEDAIYINFIVHEECLRAVNTANNSTVCQDSCVEFFVAVEGNPRYWNLEFNCIGTIHASSRTERHNATRLSDNELDSVIRYASLGNKPFGELSEARNWNLLVIIPLSLINVSYNGSPIQLRGNLYKCADKSAMPHYLSWSPIKTEKPNFHCPEFFGTLTLL